MNKEILNFTRGLYLLVKSGIPILRSLEILYEQMPASRMRRVLEDIILRIQEGEFFSEALEAHRRVFSELYINMVRAGEISARLVPALGELFEFLIRSRRLKQKIISSIMYPGFILLTAVAILSVVMIFVVPVLTNIFHDLNRELPPLTQLIIKVSKFAGKWWWLGLGFLSLLFLIYRLILRTPRGAYKLNIYRWKLPGLGSLLRNIAIERFCRCLGVMLSSGVNLLEALRATRQVVSDPLLKEALSLIIEKVKEGVPLSQSMEEIKIFPLSLVKIVSVAEEGGKLSSIFLEIAQDYEEELNTLLTGLVALMEPLLIVGMGLVVGTIIIGLLFPVFTMSGSFQ